MAATEYDDFECLWDPIYIPDSLPHDINEQVDFGNDLAVVGICWNSQEGDRDTYERLLEVSAGIDVDVVEIYWRCCNHDGGKFSDALQRRRNFIELCASQFQTKYGMASKDEVLALLNRYERNVNKIDKETMRLVQFLLEERTTAAMEESVRMANACVEELHLAEQRPPLVPSSESLMDACIKCGNREYVVMNRCSCPICVPCITEVILHNIDKICGERSALAGTRNRDLAEVQCFCQSSSLELDEIERLLREASTEETKGASVDTPLKRLEVLAARVRMRETWNNKTGGDAHIPYNEVCLGCKSAKDADTTGIIFDCNHWAHAKCTVQLYELGEGECPMCGMIMGDGPFAHALA